MRAYLKRRKVLLEIGYKDIPNLLELSITNIVSAKYIKTMKSHATSTMVSSTAFTPAEISALLSVGLLTSTTNFTSNSALFASPGATSLAAVSTAGSRHAAGSLGAVGGQQATEHIHGGISLSSSRTAIMAGSYNFSLPHMGAHIKLLVDARNHLIGILKKTKHKEMPLDTLRERWDGGVASHTEQAERKKLRGEFFGVLPGKTKKWRQFYGMRFEWVLEECLGAGMVELFETGSVGRAVKIVS